VGGVKFRRQHEYGPFILDFYCHERKLVIEVDGGQHAAPKNAAEDAARTLYLESHGLRVLRFTNLGGAAGDGGRACQNIRRSRAELT